MACLCLPNYLRQTENSLYIPQGFVDVELADGKIKEGECRVTGRARWFLKVDETPKRWPEKSCSERTSRKFETLRE